MLHRRNLPIATPCREFASDPARAPNSAFCTRCDRQVHWLGALDEAEVMALVEASRGEVLCVAYRTHRDGRIALRPRAARAAVLATGLLAACAGRPLAPTQVADGHCRDHAAADCPQGTKPVGDATPPRTDGDADPNAPFGGRSDDVVVGTVQYVEEPAEEPAEVRPR